MAVCIGIEKRPRSNAAQRKEYRSFSLQRSRGNGKQTQKQSQSPVVVDGSGRSVLVRQIFRSAEWTGGTSDSLGVSTEQCKLIKLRFPAV